jgi:PAS domain S-box-containing protein
VQRVLESLFAARGDFVYVFDRDLRYHYVNPAGAQVLGMTPQQMLGKTSADLFPAERVAEQEARVGEVVRTKQPSQMTRRLIDAYGAPRVYESALTPIIGEDGEVELIVAAGQDITDRVVAEERGGLLQLLTQRLAATLSQEEIGVIVVEQLHEYLRADASVVFFEADDGSVRLAAYRGITEETVRERAVMPLDTPIPLARAIRTRTSIWFPDRASMLREFPNVRDKRILASTVEATASIPFVLEGRARGGMAFSFARPTRFDGATRDFLETFALQCAQALERTRLFEEERRARVRLAVLAQTSDQLARAQLDLTQVLHTLCQEIATQLPESCTINLVNAAGTHLDLAATHHIDPTAELRIRETLARNPIGVGDGALGRVVATGESVLVPVVSLEQWRASVRPEYRDHIDQHPISSLLIVPLRIGQRVIGTVTASRQKQYPSFTPDDRTLLQDLADRASFAIENARLFEAEREARKLRDDFLSIAGHELRTPLSAMQLQLESIRNLATNGALADKPGLLVERLDKAIRNVGRLEHLIAALLDVSKLVAGQLAIDREHFDLRELAHEVADRFVDAAGRAGSPMELLAEAPVAGHWDRGRLDQVITNLVDNAIKYGQGKPVSILIESGDGRARITVRDQGLGIAPDAQERIFGRFERAVSSRHYGGLGLGLWISRQLVEAHGGRIDVSSAPGSGTTFVVEIPIAAAAVAS